MYNKYHVAVKDLRTYNGIIFSSRAEMLRYKQLFYLQKNKKISNLKLQPKFILQEGFVDNSGKRHKPIIYIADFEYLDDKGVTVVEDIKGFVTKEYSIKKKLFLYRFRDLKFFENKTSKR